MKILYILSLLVFLTSCAGGNVAKVKFGKRCTAADDSGLKESSYIWLISKDALKSGIDDLVGIGPVLKDKLLKKYKSFIRLKEVEEDELIEFLGKNRGRSVFNQLRN